MLPRSAYMEYACTLSRTEFCPPARGGVIPTPCLSRGYLSTSTFSPQLVGERRKQGLSMLVSSWTVRSVPVESLTATMACKSAHNYVSHDETPGQYSVQAVSRYCRCPCCTIRGAELALERRGDDVEKHSSHGRHSRSRTDAWLRISRWHNPLSQRSRSPVHQLQ